MSQDIQQMERNNDQITFFSSRPDVVFSCGVIFFGMSDDFLEEMWSIRMNPKPVPWVCLGTLAPIVTWPTEHHTSKQLTTCLPQPHPSHLNQQESRSSRFLNRLFHHRKPPCAVQAEPGDRPRSFHCFLKQGLPDTWVLITWSEEYWSAIQPSWGHWHHRDLWWPQEVQTVLRTSLLLDFWSPH